MTQPKYPLRAINETGDKTIDVQNIIVPDSAITAGSGDVNLATATGDVTGPSSATDNAITRFNGTTGKVVQNSAAFVDDNGNVYAPNVAGGSVSIATAAGTTTLTVASKGTQVFTGVTTQTVVLPVVTTLPQIGFGYHIINDSTGALTVNSSGANLVQTIPAGGRALITCILLTGTSAASWASTFTTAASSAGAMTLTTPNLGTPASGNLGNCTGGALTSYLATTVTYNANAVLADTPLSVTVAAGGIYDIELVVHSTSAVKALLMDFAGTATIANFIGEWVGFNASSPVDGSGARVTTAGTDFGPGGLFDGADDYYTFTGSVEITDAGTFLLRGAQNVSDASNTTILRGSTLTLLRMA